MIETLKTRRSIRRFEHKKVEKEKVDEIIKATLRSPSSRSRRPWEFVIVDDKKVLSEISESREHGSTFIKDAPLAIIVIADKDICDVWIEDASIAAVMIQVAAHSLGLGTCWIQARDRNKSDNLSTNDYLKKLLNIPDQFMVECMIAVGYPAEIKKPYTDEELHYSKIHYNAYNR